jgi:hypothetical protein
MGAAIATQLRFMRRPRIAMGGGFSLDRLSRCGAGGSSVMAGALAAATWLQTRCISAPIDRRWHVELALDVADEPAPLTFDEMTATRLHLDIYAEEWGFYMCHAGRSSWIRVTDIAFVHGRDELQLLDLCPPLKDIGSLVRRFEQTHRVRFRRDLAAVTTNLAVADPTIRSWLQSL